MISDFNFRPLQEGDSVRRYVRFMSKFVCFVLARAQHDSDQEYLSSTGLDPGAKRLALELNASIDDEEDSHVKLQALLHAVFSLYIPINEKRLQCPVSQFVLYAHVAPTGFLSTNSITQGIAILQYCCRSVILRKIMETNDAVYVIICHANL